MIEEHMQEMIDRETLMIDVAGEVNGLAVYPVADYLFGKPSRIRASTAMGRAGIINIEREAEMSGSTHNKGVLILNGYLREKYARDKPLSMSASIAFEQSYGGVDGDSASSTDEGIEILTGKDAGEKQSEETYLKGAINFLVNEKLKKFAEGLKAFGEKEEILNHERL